MYFLAIGLVAIFWATGNDSADFLVRTVVGILGAIVMIGSVKLYKLGNPPKFEKEY